MIPSGMGRLGMQLASARHGIAVPAVAVHSSRSSLQQPPYLITGTPTPAAQITHLVIGGERRTLKLMLAVANGAWLVSPQWVTASLEAGRWLPESQFPAKVCDSVTNVRVLWWRKLLVVDGVCLGSGKLLLDEHPHCAWL